MRAQAIEFVEKILFAILSVVEAIKNFARRNIRARQRNFLAALNKQDEIIVAGVRQSFFRENRAGRDDFGQGAFG